MATDGSQDPAALVAAAAAAQAATMPPPQQQQQQGAQPQHRIGAFPMSMIETMSGLITPQSSQSSIAPPS
jgi:hypothetical protein